MTAEQGVHRPHAPREDRGRVSVVAGQGAAHRARWQLPGVPLVVAALLGLLISGPAARAGRTGCTVQLLAALNGAEALSASAMAKESAGGVGAGEAAGVHLPLVTPRVRLWDDFGAPSAPAIGETTVTVSGGGQQP